MKSIDKIISEIESLKPIPQVAHKVLAIMDDPNSSMAQLAEVIVHDQALTANVLRICNSPFYGLVRKVDSVHQAITYLGMKNIADMVMTKLGSELLKAEHEGYDLKDGELWKHAVSSALIARQLCEIKKIPNTHLVYTGALLKDIGKVILHKYVGDAFDEIGRLVKDESISFREAEKRVLGIDHAELGGIVAERWGFSDRMVHIIKNHHLNGEWSPDDLETAIVYLADIICMMMGLGVGADGLAYRFHEQVIEALAFSDKDLQEIMAGFAQRLGEVEELIYGG